MNGNLTATIVIGTREIAQGYAAVELQTNVRSALPQFGDGALVDTTRRGSNGVVRTYPLCCSSTRRDAYVIGMRTGGGLDDERGTFDTGMKDGDEILVGTPYTTPVTVNAGARYILLGGGVGIAAIAAVARKLTSCGVSFEVHHFARTPERAVFRDMLDEVQLHGKVRHYFGLSTEHIAQKVAHALGPTHASSQIYCSGPPAFMDIVQQSAQEWVHKENIHRIILGKRGGRLSNSAGAD